MREVAKIFFGGKLMTTNVYFLQQSIHVAIEFTFCDEEYLLPIKDFSHHNYVSRWRYFKINK